ncbi:MAG: hypothetical protein KZQ66_08380, partial [Candidatus Thiodiazotropha sp. (ex Lucinoma aequizonata)]|nr:hypothetical protein [Candidatus Thiodiazotropha sp. (ex Lucinoma aequizonata)]MCU7902006.1 hypothetical protein [Candidatus Thiodiazotropha sp. (ex Lucinoma aequizonata)]
MSSIKGYRYVFLENGDSAWIRRGIRHPQFWYRRRIRGRRVIVKSGVYAFESSDDLINFCHLNTVFEFN